LIVIKNGVFVVQDLFVLINFVEQTLIAKTTNFFFRCQSCFATTTRVVSTPERSWFCFSASGTSTLRWDAATHQRGVIYLVVFSARVV